MNREQAQPMAPEEMAGAVAAEIEELLREKGRVIVAIDGRCGSGKSTLAEAVQRTVDCCLFHMDDFYLRSEQRTEERYREPGGNVDRERFSREVLRPLLAGETFSYRPLKCPALVLGEPIAVSPGPVSLVEGTYSCHPALWDSYDLHVFLTTSPETQMARIKGRNGAAAEAFRDCWIPLEERYFSAFRSWERCELVFST